MHLRPSRVRPIEPSSFISWRHTIPSPPTGNQCPRDSSHLLLAQPASLIVSFLKSSGSSPSYDVACAEKATHMEKVVIPFAAAVVVVLLLLPPPFSAARTVPSDNCTRICGNISIPYPFGIEPGCYHAGGFNLTCSLINHTVHGHAQHRLFLGDGTVQVLKISIPANTIRINSPRVMLKDYGGYTINGTWGSGLPEGGPYALAESVNSVAVVGCNVQVDLRGGVNNGLLGSCSAVCPYINTPNGPAQITRIGHKCAGVGCCQAKNILEYSFYHIEIHMPDMNNTADATDSIAVYLADGVVDYTDNMTLYSFPQTDSNRHP
ncbi:hypothetical protein EJB05_15685, partial [Eragrostis curvula]